MMDIDPKTSSEIKMCIPRVASEIIVDKIRMFPMKRTALCAAKGRYFRVIHWKTRKATIKKNSAPEENNMLLL